jgi:DNA-binding NarL/FixJ family response regulator
MSKYPLLDAGQHPASVRILVVDDYEPWRQWVYLELGRQQQLQVVGDASDGVEAVRRALELKPDLILLDIGLPKLNGLEAASRIIQNNPHTKIIFLTQERAADVVKHALRNGANGYVLKDYAKTELLAAVAAVLQGARFVSSRLAMKLDDCDCE